MNEPANSGDNDVSTSLEQRVLILTPTGRDADMTRQILASAGIQTRVCDYVQQVCEELKVGAAAVLIADETLTDPALQCLLKGLDEQESWSDVPVIVFRTHAENAAILLERLGSRANVTILERPVQIAILINAVKSAVRARTRQYQTRRLLLQLENADRQKDLFLAMLSHELRTPLNAIMGWCRILKRDGLDPEMKARALEVINRNAESQALLITDILSVSQIVAGTLRIEMEPVHLENVIRATIESIRPTAEGKDIQLRYSCEGPSGVVLGDAHRLQQVVSNLVSNSLKFTAPGGEIDVELIGTESDMKIIVRDNGKGIEPEFLPYVFDRFRQADNSYTRSQSGLGLGLAIVRHLVELHCGSIRAESAGTNRGSTFTVILPVSSAVERADAKPCEAEDPLLAGLQILAVDDDKDSLTMLASALGQYGANVTTVTSAAEALQAITKREPDVLVSDIGMPDQDGYELLLQVSATRSGALIPAIAVTGYASQKDRERAFQAGYRAHFVKPFEPVELARSIESLARRRNS